MAIRRNVFTKAATAFGSFRRDVSAGFDNIKGSFLIGDSGGSSGSPFSTQGNYYRALLPGSQIDWQAEAGPLWLNGVVSICLSKILLNFFEPDLQVIRTLADGTAVPIPGHPLVDLIEQPNTLYDGEALMAAALVCMLVDGNGYWLKSRAGDGYGAVKELYYVPFWQMTPRIKKAGTSTGYELVYDRRVNGKTESYPAADVVHFKFGTNPENPLEGFAPLKAVLRDIVSDNEASTYIVSILRNLGVVVGMFTPVPTKDGQSFTFSDDDKIEFKRKWRSKTTGDNRGAEVLIPSVPAKYQRVGATPEELALDKIVLRPEARIHGALGVPPMVSGLNVGDMQRSYANYAEARAAFNEECLIPNQTRMTRVLTRNLLREMDKDKSRGTRWDYSNVRSMQPDRSANGRYAVMVYRGGVATLNEARAEVGLQPSAGEGGDAYYVGPAGDTEPGIGGESGE